MVGETFLHFGAASRTATASPQTIREDRGERKDLLFARRFRTQFRGSRVYIRRATVQDNPVHRKPSIMKLKTNLFIGKKPSLEEGQMIYTVSDDDTAVNGAQRSRSCRICLRLLKVIFYVLLFLMLLCLVWFGFLYVTNMLAQPKPMCSVDYIDWDGEFNTTEINDMIKHAEDLSSRIDYANIDPMDESLPDQGVEEFIGFLDEAKTG